MEEIVWALGMGFMVGLLCGWLLCRWHRRWKLRGVKAEVRTELGYNPPPKGLKWPDKVPPAPPPKRPTLTLQGMNVACDESVSLGEIHFVTANGTVAIKNVGLGDNRPKESEQEIYDRKCQEYGERIAELLNQFTAAVAPTPEGWELPFSASTEDAINIIEDWLSRALVKK